MSSIEGIIQWKIVSHWRLSIFISHCRLSCPEGHFSLEVIFHWRLFFIEGSLHFPSKVFFHQVSSSIKGHHLSCQWWSHKPTITVWSNPSSNFSDNDDLNKQWLSCAQMRSASQFDFSLNKLRTRLSCINVKTSFILMVRLVM